MRHRELQDVQGPHPTQTQSIPVTPEEAMGVRSPAGLITAHQKPGEKTQALRKQRQIVSGNLYAHMKITAKVTPYFCYPNLDSLSTTA